jgi:GDP-L-fucose synthase
MRNPRILILGATGFAGRNVWTHLKDQGCDVHGLSRTSGCDLTRLPSAYRAVEAVRPDYIVNCAAFVGSINFVQDFAADVVDQNMRMLLNLYKIAQQMRETMVINPIANCGYPGALDLYSEKDFWAGPMDPSVKSYGSTRRMIDVLSQAYSAQYGVRTTNLFVPNMYGPYDSPNPNKTHALNALVIKFVSAMKQGRDEVEVWGTGKPVREWLYVKDLARLIHLVISSGEHRLEPVNAAQNHGLSVDELVEIITQSVGYKGRVVKNLRYGDGSMRKVMDDSLFKSRFPGFKFTDFFQGLNETIRYYQTIL